MDPEEDVCFPCKSWCRRQASPVRCQLGRAPRRLCASAKDREALSVDLRWRHVLGREWIANTESMIQEDGLCLMSRKLLRRRRSQIFLSSRENQSTCLSEAGVRMRARPWPPEAHGLRVSSSAVWWHQSFRVCLRTFLAMPLLPSVLAAVAGRGMRRSRNTYFWPSPILPGIYNVLFRCTGLL